MKRMSALLAAIGIALATAATGWAIGVNTGVFSDGPNRDPVSARIETTDTATPETVETIYVDVTASPQGDQGGGVVAEESSPGNGGATASSSGGSSDSEAPAPVSRPAHDDDDDDDVSSPQKRQDKPEDDHDGEDEHDDD